MEVAVGGSKSVQEVPMAQVEGIMFVSGYVMSIKQDGKAGIVCVRGGGGKFVLIQLAHFYVKQKPVQEPHTLHTFLQRGSYINLFMEDLGKERMIVTFRVRYEAVMCWVGTQGKVPDVGPYKEFWQRQALNSASRVPYNIYVDVPTSSLSEHSGVVYWCSATYGLVSIRQKKSVTNTHNLLSKNRPYVTNALFTSDCFYLGQKKILPSENLAYPAADAFVVAITQPIPPRKIFGVYVEMEAVAVFLGDKPDFTLIYRDPSLKEAKNEDLQTDDNDNYSKRTCSNEDQSTSWADEADDDTRLKKNVEVEPIQKDHVLQKSLNASAFQIASYMTGRFLGTYKNCFLYGSEGKACRFMFENFHVSNLKLLSVKSVLKYLHSQKTPLLHGYVFALEKPIDVSHKIRLLWDAVCVWHGPAPISLKMKLSCLKKVPLRQAVDASHCSSASEVLVDRKDLMATMPQEPFHDAVKRGRLTGFALSCSASDAIVTGFSNTVYITRERFYVNGMKYRGTSLLSFFQRRNEKVNMYVVPMQMRVVRNCAIYSRAVCAWVGDEPDDLQEMILKDKIYTNFEVTDNHEKSPGQFYYMVGHVQKIGETCGMIECKVDNSTANIGFSIHELYKYGKKVSSRSIMSMHSQVLLTSRWSVLAYFTPHQLVAGSSYTAVAVWHHGDQTSLFDEFQNKLPVWHQQVVKGKCLCSDSVSKLVNKAVSSISKGAITEARKDEVAVGIKNQGIVWVKRDCIVVDGCCCCLSKVDEHRMCYVGFDSNKVPLYAWMGKHPDTGRSCGGIDIRHIDCTSEDSDDEIDAVNDCGNNYGEDDEDVNDISNDLTSMEFSDPSELFSIAKKGQSFQKGVEGIQKKSVKCRHHELDKFSGIHATGNVVKIEADYAILSWFSEQIKGIIFVYLDLNHLYINGDPFRKTCYMQLEGDKVLTNHNCHFYFNTIPESERYGSLEICAVATAGWIGKKPIFMPPPGKQGKGLFDIHALRIAYAISPHFNVEFCSFDFWSALLKKDPLQKTFRSSRQLSRAFSASTSAFPPDQTTCATSQLESKPFISNGFTNFPVDGFQSTAAGTVLAVAPQYRDRPTSLLQKHLNGSVQSTMTNIVATAQGHPTSTSQVVFSSADDFRTSSVENSVVSQLNHTNTAASVFTGSTGLDNFTLSPATGTLGNGECAATSSTHDGRSGKVVELHPSLGKLLGVDGAAVYFKPGQFFLFGIPLYDVELYNILVQDLEVQYCTDPLGQLEACWYGSRVRDGTSYTHLTQWCADNLVPADVHELLTRRVNED